MWCLVFLFTFWDPYSTTEIGLAFHFIVGGDGCYVLTAMQVSLLLYDGCLSLVMLAHSSLLADLTVNSEDVGFA